MKIGDIVGIRWVDAIVRDHADSSTNLACPTAITYGKLVFQCDGYVSVAAEEFLDLDTKGDLRQVTLHTDRDDP